MGGGRHSAAQEAAVHHAWNGDFLEPSVGRYVANDVRKWLPSQVTRGARD